MRRRLLAIPLLGLLVATAALTRSDDPSPAPPPIDRPLEAVSASAKAVRVSTNPARFTTLPPGSSLPTDAQCTAAVRRGGGEVRAGNATPNATRGRQKNLTPPDFSRVTGDFTGTTDEILQWAACKWGIDEDMVRAQIAKESWWHQEAKGDWTTNGAVCPPNHPPGADGRPASAPRATASRSCAGSTSGTSSPRARRRRPTTSTPPTPRGAAASRVARRGSTPSSGGGTTPPVTPGAASAGGSRAAGTPLRPLEYIAAVQDYLNRRIWETPDFRAG